MIGGGLTAGYICLSCVRARPGEEGGIAWGGWEKGGADGVGIEAWDSVGNGRVVKSS